MNDNDRECLKRVYLEARKLVSCLSYPTTESEDHARMRTIDHLLMGGSYLPDAVQELPEEEYWKSQAEKYRTAAKCMALIIVILLVFDLFGVSSLWELVF